MSNEANDLSSRQIKAPRRRVRIDFGADILMEPPQVPGVTPSGKPLQIYLDRYDENRRRVIGLVRLYSKLQTLQADSQPEGTPFDVIDEGAIDDILRSALVFSHAALEDFLRSMAEDYLSSAGYEELKSIPLANEDNSQSEKFALCNLIQHKGKTVDQLIQQSVKQYLDRWSLSEISNVTTLLVKIGFNVKNLGGKTSNDMPDIYSKIEKMIKRRHQIVHKTDRANTEAQENSIAPVEPQEVMEWLKASHKFAVTVMVEAFLVTNNET